MKFPVMALRSTCKARDFMFGVDTFTVITFILFISTFDFLNSIALHCSTSSFVKFFSCSCS